MKNFDDIEGEQARQFAASKRGLAIALVLLAATLIVAGIAYASLANQAKEELAAQEAADEARSSASMPQLADYNCTVLDDDGNEVDLVQIADGRPLVLNFWATWCPFCIDELPDYQKLYDEYRDRVSFAFIDVADGTRETIEDARLWLAGNDYDLAAYYDTTLEATYAFGATGLPTTAVVSPQGDIVYIAGGIIDPDHMRSLLDSLLEG